MSTVSTAAPENADHFQHHTVGLFLGATDAEHYPTEFTYGIEYGYKFTPRFGLGAVYERTEDGHGGAGVELAVGSAYYSPAPGWRLGLGAGREEVDGGDSETLYRAGVAYHFHLGRFGLAPTFNVDRVDGDHALVYGVSLTTSF